MPIGIPKDTATGDLRRATDAHTAHGAPPEAPHLRPTHWRHLDRRGMHG
jgi:hypothetical protein